MEKDSFGETFISFPLIGKKENSTYYKTFYSGNPHNKSKTRNKHQNSSNPKIGRTSSKIIIERNRAVSSFGKYASQLQNNKYSKNKRKKLTSLMKNKNSFSSCETDDTFFALSEIKMMDKKIEKRINKGLIWKEKLESIYDICTSQNKKDIDKVRELIRGTDEEDKNFDLREEIDKKKYFPIEKVETINEAKKIMNNFKNAMINEKKAYETFYNKNRIDLHTFVIQNREICK